MGARTGAIGNIQRGHEEACYAVEGMEGMTGPLLLWAVHKHDLIEFLYSPCQQGLLLFHFIIEDTKEAVLGHIGIQ